MFVILNVLNATAKREKSGWDLRFLEPTVVPNIIEEQDSKSAEGIYPGSNYSNYGNGSMQSNRYQPQNPTYGYRPGNQGNAYQRSIRYNQSYSPTYNNAPQYSAVQPEPQPSMDNGLFSIIQPSNITSIAQLGIQGISSIRETKKLAQSRNEDLSYIPIDVDEPSADGKKHNLKMLMECADADNGLCCLMPNYCHIYADCSSEFNLNVSLASVLAAVPRCQCKPGFIGDGRTKGTGCQNVDECASGTHKCDHQCTDAIPGYICTCHAGFKLAADLRSCIDMDECEAGTHSCSDICINTPGSYKCGCRPGFVLGDDGMTCQEIDECKIMSELLMNRTTLDFNMIDTLIPCKFPDLCVNTEGSFKCGCPSGYRQEGNRCVDIDECELEYRCPENTSCMNRVGYYECLCDGGYRTSTPTIYEPMKDELGFVAASVHEEFFDAIVRRSISLECSDIDECDGEIQEICPYDDRVGRQPACVNTDGSYICSCSRYKGESVISDPTEFSWDIELELIYDEGLGCVIKGACADDVCGENSRCDFNNGVQVCTCLAGYWNMDNHCVDFDECSIFKELTDNQVAVWDRAGDIEKYSGGCYDSCINERAGYHCTCPTGFENINGECQDIDECSGKSCRGGCINMEGSYICACPPGYQAYTYEDSNYADESIIGYYQVLHDRTYPDMEWNTYILDQPRIEELWRQFMKLDANYCRPFNFCDEEVDGVSMSAHCQHGQTCRDRLTLNTEYDISHPMICECAEGYESVFMESVSDTITGGIIEKSMCEDIDECLIAQQTFDVGTKSKTCKKNRPCCLNTTGGYRCTKSRKGACVGGAIDIYNF